MILHVLEAKVCGPHSLLVTFDDVDLRIDVEQRNLCDSKPLYRRSEGRRFEVEDCDRGESHIHEPDEKEAKALERARFAF